jgi:hypothetical protein
MWLYAAQAEQSGCPVLLFCARGGIGIRETFERVVAKLDLPLRARRENFMVSRLVAARAALLSRCPSVEQELNREFHKDRLSDVACALGGRSYELGREWLEPFTAPEFLKLLFSSSGKEVLADIEKQNALFERHLQQLVRTADRLILCDTGLYGSTQRLLADAFPRYRFEMLQFARANYKRRHGEEHFPSVSGLLVEENCYNPLHVASCVLRYWQLVERLFEPDVPSVRSFQEDVDGQVMGNCGDVKFGSFGPAAWSDLLMGAWEYVDNLPPNGGPSLFDASDGAWHRLKRAITRPGDAEILTLGTGTRSVDFGRSGHVEILSSEHAARPSKRLLCLKAQLWREGAIACAFPIGKHFLLPMMSSAHVVRGLLRARFR